MPSLIRLLIVLIVLAGLGFAGMIALTVMVDPG
jgi:phage shock protein PspC (stress-responsive transcriptional regulator)